MHAPANIFQKKMTPARRWNYAASIGFGVVTYFILLCAALMFLVLLWRGSSMIFQPAPPFINIRFLTQKPETLHIFEYQGKKIQLGDHDYHKFTQNIPNSEIINAKTYSHSAGGIFPCIVGTILLVVGAIVIALFFGVLSAVYLNEYSRDGPFIRIIRLAIVNLAGVPSIVFGLFGSALFVLIGPIFTSTPAQSSVLAIPLWIGGLYLSFQGWGVSLLAGWFTLAFMILPIVITASEESLRAVPRGFREGSLALGATQWQTIRTNVLPYAAPGILTSSILGITRVAGETAAIMFTAAFVVRDALPWQIDKFSDFFFQGVMALPYHIYVLAAKVPQSKYTADAQFGTCFVFLLIVFLISLTSILLRAKLRKKLKW